MKMKGSKIIKNMLKYAVYCLGFGMFQLSGATATFTEQWPVERKSIYSRPCQYEFDGMS